MKCKKLIALITSLALLPISVIPAKAEDINYVYGEDNWYFSNSPLVLGNFYRLTEQDKTTMQKLLSPTEKRVFEEGLKQPWEGCCYGLAVTSILAANGLIDPGQYWDGAQNLHEVQLSEPVKSLINFYQVAQGIGPIRQERLWSFYHQSSNEILSELLSLAKEGKPSLLCFSGHFMDDEEIGGHAVTAYGYEECQFEWQDQIYDGRVLIYDSNFSIFHDENCLYYNSKNGNWCIPAYKLNTEDGDTLTFVTADIDLLNHHGLVGGTEYKSEKEPMISLSSTPINGEHTCTRTTYNGKNWVDTQDNSGIKEFAWYVGNSIYESDLDYIMPDDESGYLLHLQEEESLDVAMFYEGLLLRAEGTAQNVRFSPEGIIQIQSSGKPYKLEIVADDVRYDGSYYDITVSGTAGTVQLQSTENGYILTTDLLKDVQITALNDTQSDVIKFSAEEDSVLIYETDTHRLAAMIDADGDGSFETPVDTGYLLGDLNGDKTVDASDASEILIASANIGAGSDSGLTQTQKTAADADGNGIFDASDAALVLMYAAEFGAGSFWGDLAQFVEEAQDAGT